MPVWPLNNAQTQNAYVDALTVHFPTGRDHFSLQVYNAGVYYQLIAYDGQNYYADPTEHFLAPVLAGFDSPAAEGLAEGQQFGGIQLRSAVLGSPASVTVI